MKDTTEKVFTRKQYLAGECTHRQYNAQFVTEGYKGQIKRHIGLDRILNSTDEHLNDIPLIEWDNAPLTLGVDQKMKNLGDYLTLAGKVCIAKEAAKQIKEENER